MSAVFIVHPAHHTKKNVNRTSFECRANSSSTAVVLQSRVTDKAVDGMKLLLEGEMGDYCSEGGRRVAWYPRGTEQCHKPPVYSLLQTGQWAGQIYIAVIL